MSYEYLLRLLRSPPKKFAKKTSLRHRFQSFSHREDAVRGPCADCVISGSISYESECAFTQPNIVWRSDSTALGRSDAASVH